MCLWMIVKNLLLLCLMFLGSENMLSGPKDQIMWELWESWVDLKKCLSKAFSVLLNLNYLTKSNDIYRRNTLLVPPCTANMGQLTSWKYNSLKLTDFIALVGLPLSGGASGEIYCHFLNAAATIYIHRLWNYKLIICHRIPRFHCHLSLVRLNCKLGTYSCLDVGILPSSQVKYRENLFLCVRCLGWKHVIRPEGPKNMRKNGNT